MPPRKRGAAVKRPANGVKAHTTKQSRSDYKWFLEKFSFLSRHIYRIPSRAGVDLMSKNREKHPERMQDSQDSDEEEEVGEDKLPASLPAISSASWETDTSAAAKRKRKPFLQRLDERIQQSSQMQEKLFKHMSMPTDPRAAERHKWTQWFGAAIPDIDDSLWSEFQAESLRLVNTFKGRSKRVQPAHNP